GLLPAPVVLDVDDPVVAEREDDEDLAVERDAADLRQLRARDAEHHAVLAYGQLQPVDLPPLAIHHRARVGDHLLPVAADQARDDALVDDRRVERAGQGFEVLAANRVEPVPPDDLEVATAHGVPRPRSTAGPSGGGSGGPRAPTRPRGCVRSPRSERCSSRSRSCRSRTRAPRAGPGRRSPPRWGSPSRPCTRSTAAGCRRPDREAARPPRRASADARLSRP